MDKIDVIEGVNGRKCYICGEVKTFENFSKKKNGKFGLDSRCKECIHKQYERNKEEYKRRSKERYHNNKWEHLEYGRQWRSKNREYDSERKRNRRALLKNSEGVFTEKEFREYSLTFFKNKCAYSGVSVVKDCHRDHVVPISKGGVNYIWNIVPCNGGVNASKSDCDNGRVV